MLANLVQDAVFQGRLKEIDSEYMSGICQIIVSSSAEICTTFLMGTDN